MPQAKTLILGIGNTLLSDEGVGIHVIRHLEERTTRYPEVELLDGGTLSFSLATAIEDAEQLIVIDAAELNAEPGSLQTFVGDEMDAFLGGHNKRSVHEVGLIDLMTITRLAGRLPNRRALIGIQPQKIDWGELPTAAVQAAIPHACEQAMRLLEDWRA